jgi:MMP alpha-(1->4)-mannosyltransferase
MGQAEALAAAVRRLLGSPSFRARLGNAGRETAVRYFSPEGQAMSLAKLFREMVS